MAATGPPVIAPGGTHRGLAEAEIVRDLLVRTAVGDGDGDGDGDHHTQLSGSEHRV